MEVGWVHIGAASVAAGVVALLLVLFLWRFCCYTPKPTTERLQLEEGIARLHRQADMDHANKQQRGIGLGVGVGVGVGVGGGNYYLFRRGAPTRPMFTWADYPSLVTDAVENGWSRFGFTGGYMTSSTRSPLLGLCAAGDCIGRQASEVEIGWEISQGSADFMQRIRLNCGLKRWVMGGDRGMGAESVVRTALPLPGPPLGNLSFPQEAYFEITVLASGEGDYGGDQSGGGKIRESEKAKLIQQNLNMKLKANSDSLVHITSLVNKIDDFSGNGGRSEAVAVSVGLTGGGSLPFKLPGSYPGSIGFNSNGSVYLDGIKLVFESEKAEWGRKDQVIGCGFDPRNKKVFFTLDSEVVHVFHCQPEEFGAPLYPTLAANCDITVLVNYGQSSFTYSPANSQRTPNPCFIAPIVNSPAALGYDDSKELFSMGRIDSQWLDRSATKGSYNNGTNTNMAEDFDAESEADLFEIALDTNTK